MAEDRGLADHIREVGREYPDADVVAYYGPIVRPFDDQFVSRCDIRTPARKNLILILGASGGDAEAGYRIARALHRRWGLLSLAPQGAQPRLSVFVDGPCASPGTMIAVGATDLIMSETAELRPLDARLPATYEGTAAHSALSLSRALEGLEQRYIGLFREELDRWTADGELPDRSAVEMSSVVATAQLAPHYGRLDPASFAYAQQALTKISAYAERLARSNLKPGALDRLVSGYPSADFVIDRSEAEELFYSVAAPKPALKALADHLRRSLPTQVDQRPLMQFLTEPSSATRPVADPVPLQPVTAAASEPAETTAPKDRAREAENLDTLLQRPAASPPQPVVRRGKIEERVAAVWHNEIYA